MKALAPLVLAAGQQAVWTGSTRLHIWAGDVPITLCGLQPAVLVRWLVLNDREIEAGRLCYYCRRRLEELP